MKKLKFLILLNIFILNIFSCVFAKHPSEWIWNESKGTLTYLIGTSTSDIKRSPNQALYVIYYKDPVSNQEKASITVNAANTSYVKTLNSLKQTYNDYDIKDSLYKQYGKDNSTGIIFIYTLEITKKEVQGPALPEGFKYYKAKTKVNSTEYSGESNVSAEDALKKLKTRLNSAYRQYYKVLTGEDDVATETSGYYVITYYDITVNNITYDGKTGKDKNAKSTSQQTNTNNTVNQNVSQINNINNSVPDLRNGYKWEQSGSKWWVHNSSNVYPYDGWALTNWDGPYAAEFDSNGYWTGKSFTGDAAMYVYNSQTYKGAKTQQWSGNTSTGNVSNVTNNTQSNINSSQGIITPNVSSGGNITNSNPININTQDVINLKDYKDISKYNLGNIQVSEYVDINSNGASIIKTDSGNDISTNNINSDYDSDTVDEILQDGSYTGDMWKSTTGTIKDQGSKYNNQYNWEAITELDGWQNWTVSNKTSELKGIWAKYNENTWYFITNATEQATYIQNEEKGTVKKVSQAYIIEDIASDITLCIDKKLYKFNESGICTTPDGVKGNKGIITLKADGTIDKGHEPELEENDINLPIYEKSDSAHTSTSYYYITYENTKNYSCLANGYFILKSSDTSFALYRADSNGKLSKQSSAGTSLYKINEYLKKNGSSYEAPDTIEVNDGKVTSTKTSSSTNTSNTKTTNNTSTNIISSKTTSNIDSGYVSNGKYYNTKDNMTYTVNSDGIITGMNSGNKSSSTSGSYEVIDIGDNSFLKKS